MAVTDASRPNGKRAENAEAAAQLRAGEKLLAGGVDHRDGVRGDTGDMEARRSPERARRARAVTRSAQELELAQRLAGLSRTTIVASSRMQSSDAIAGLPLH